MAETTGISWTHSTLNPWRGCTRVSEGCRNCYAETLSNRNPLVLGVWGPQGTRVIAAEATWKEPLKWNRLAVKDGQPWRVFCASLADVFEDWPGPLQNAQEVQLWRRDDGSWTTSDHYRDTVALSLDHVRARLWDLIEATPHLTWQLLTKRPENCLRMAPERWRDGWPKNVWLGTSVEDQPNADERLPHLLAVPAALHWLSVEPLLGPTNLHLGQRDEGQRWERHHLLSWVVVGGESGKGHRPCQVEWIADISRQCREAGTALFVKQDSGPRPGQQGRIPDDLWALKQFPIP